MSKVAKAHIALFLVALIYGANYSIAKLVLDDNYILPFGFIVFRILSGVGLFWFFHLVFVREKIKKEDIPELTDHFNHMIANDYGNAPKLFSADAIKELQKLDWSGNIREFRNVIERLIILCDREISAKDVKMFANK